MQNYSSKDALGGALSVPGPGPMRYLKCSGSYILVSGRQGHFLVQSLRAGSWASTKLAAVGDLESLLGSLPCSFCSQVRCAQSSPRPRVHSHLPGPVCTSHLPEPVELQVNKASGPAGALPDHLRAHHTGGSGGTEERDLGLLPAADCLG